MNMFSVEQHLLLQRTSVATQAIKALEAALDVNTNQTKTCKNMLIELRNNCTPPNLPARLDRHLPF